MAKENMTIRIDPDLKAQAATLFKSLGMDLSTATEIFYRQALRCRGIPFEIKLDPPNEGTLSAMNEVADMKKNPFIGKTYVSVDEMMEDILS